MTGHSRVIEAEMARQDPDYAKMSPSTADGFREAWDVLERRWSVTVHHRRFAERDLAVLESRLTRS